MMLGQCLTKDDKDVLDASLDFLSCLPGCMECGRSAPAMVKGESGLTVA